MLPAVQELDWQSLSPNQIANLMKAIGVVTMQATEIERKALGLADPQKIEIDIDLEKLTKEELLDYQRLGELESIARSPSLPLLPNRT
ncbi:MAG: hypothetical protein F6J89_02235 [Symploca sp. SIO1C4]|uniref:Uncharacterized protein n=1 Tax=Symploca sp. SIO1C4 TaxID=2607765 RepID=A0A6B3N4K0_9CYAN|nr:hypothetical protein [Symploca sp. SIO1C4]